MIPAKEAEFHWLTRSDQGVLVVLSISLLYWGDNWGTMVQPPIYRGMAADFFKARIMAKTNSICILYRLNG